MVPFLAVLCCLLGQLSNVFTIQVQVEVKADAAGLMAYHMVEGSDLVHRLGKRLSTYSVNLDDISIGSILGRGPTHAIEM